MILDEKILKLMITEKYPNIDSVIIKTYSIMLPLTQNNWLKKERIILIKYIFRDIPYSTSLQYDDYIQYNYLLRKKKLDSL